MFINILMSELEIADILLILLIILVFTIIQSLFGLGLLVFGTPTLLLLGYDFVEILTYLLPSSFVISFCQVYPNQKLINHYKFNVFIYLLPMVAFGLLIVISISKINLNLFIGLILFFTFLTRFFTTFELKLSSFLSKYFRLGLSIVGLIHGLTNLGGAPLLALTNGIYTNKKIIQTNIAYAYLVMAAVQIGILLINGNFSFNPLFLLFPMASFLIFILIGNRILNLTSDSFYHTLMTYFIFIYGMLLVIKSF